MDYVKTNSLQIASKYNNDWKLSWQNSNFFELMAIQIYNGKYFASWVKTHNVKSSVLQISAISFPAILIRTRVNMIDDTSACQGHNSSCAGVLIRYLQLFHNVHTNDLCNLPHLWRKLKPINTWIQSYRRNCMGWKHKWTYNLQRRAICSEYIYFYLSYFTNQKILGAVGSDSMFENWTHSMRSGCRTSPPISSTSHSPKQVKSESSWVWRSG